MVRRRLKLMPIARVCLSPAATFVQRVLEILSRIGERDEAIRRLIIIQNNPRPLTNSETRTL